MVSMFYLHSLCSIVLAILHGSESSQVYSYIINRVKFFIVEASFLLENATVYYTSCLDILS